LRRSVVEAHHAGNQPPHWDIATVHLVAHIAALVLTAHVRNDSYLWGLWDVGPAYVMVVAVFTGWYWIADELIPEGAFDFPVPEGRDAPTPNLIDYVFIAFDAAEDVLAAGGVVERGRVGLPGGGPNFAIGTPHHGGVGLVIGLRPRAPLQPGWGLRWTRVRLRRRCRSTG
jgi:hypothetical protein